MRWRSGGFGDVGMLVWKALRDRADREAAQRRTEKRSGRETSWRVVIFVNGRCVFNFLSNC